MIEFKFSDTQDQKLSVILNGKRVGLRFRNNPLSDRLTLDLSVDGAPILHGHRMVAGTNLFAMFPSYNIGVLAVYSKNFRPATLTNFLTGSVKLYHATIEELEAALT